MQKKPKLFSIASFYMLLMPCMLLSFKINHVLIYLGFFNYLGVSFHSNTKRIMIESSLLFVELINIVHPDWNYMLAFS